MCCVVPQVAVCSVACYCQAKDKKDEKQNKPILHEQRIIWPGFETQKPKGIKISTHLQVSVLPLLAAKWMDTYWCHDIGYPLLDAEHSLCTAPWSGSLCRATSAHSRTTSPLDRVRKPGFSPDTSVFSTLESFVIIALYKLTFAIPYHFCGSSSHLFTIPELNAKCRN